MEDLMQELRNLKDFTQKCLTEIKNDIHGIFSSISSIEHKLNSVENRVVELENEQQILRDDIVEQNIRVDSLFSTIENVENKIEKAEQYSRREKLIFYGISESHSESPQAPKAKLLNMLKIVLPHTNWNDRDLVRVHRTGPQTDSSYPRPVIARFQFHCDKVQVLGKRAELKSLGIG
ncbi:hypothetical protein ElyMa_001453900, partial [Elysia marginata]